MTTLAFIAGVATCVVVEAAFLVIVAAVCLPKGGWRFK